MDTWEQYRTAAPDEPMDKRMTATLRHAGKVMATTSASTCFSFIGNTTSSFPAVYTFGAFAGNMSRIHCICCLYIYSLYNYTIHNIIFYSLARVRQLLCSLPLLSNCFGSAREILFHSKIEESMLLSQTMC